ncbi:TPA: glycosyltransferase family 1 protein [Enterococcus faecium]|uniref:glycosyltransferase family 1 protein n=1 Tax=Enterococcus faecium TaxID=1352 RepID=UPI0002A29D1B|nr:glycosyltransferase family 1 protein [Enterococcus faecium]ELA59275.1 hypothetical protein OGG_03554 [Enterococcus faecium EnGen0013]EOF93734.1 hypothetical protein SKG_01151 [Enterococcus faecium EnGen0166]MDV7710304.1 glycosyltransferase family 1 protein [Enterococcus faecium]MDW3723002.1 glycosyltransferase family 1 protein [Enterococcus faecium]HAQ7384506.1 glycosyltransferase family 1 protein [Enterococcus faecium]
MIRVLQCVNDMHRAGLETMLMNYYRHIDRSEIQFDFLTHRPYRSDYDDEIEAMGGKIYYAPRLYPQNYPAYFKYMKDFFQEHPEYKVIHSHIDSMSYLPLLAAKKAGVPIRIAHSHNTSIDRDFKYLLKQYYRFKINSVANYRLACGEMAGKYLFGKKEFRFIPNAIDSKRFVYDKAIRDIKRDELLLDGKFVIGHVGRLSYQKNHKLLVNIFKEVIKKCEDSVLVLVGTGEKEAEIKKQIKELGLEEKVILLGNRTDVNELYQAMDVFVMPSYFEGVPVVGIEAQFANLPCIFSNKVPSEVKFSKLVDFVNLDAPLCDWVDGILKYSKHYEVRGDLSEDLTNSIYEITNSVEKLSNLYRSLNP